MLLTPVLTHIPLKGRRPHAQAATEQHRAHALDRHTALHAGPSRSTVRNLHPCPARVHVRGCVLQGTRWQTREVLSPGTQRTGDS